LRTKPALLLLAGLVPGFVSGLWYAGQPSREQSPAPEQPDTNPFEQQAEQLRIEVRKKDQHLQKVGDELAALRKELATPVTLPDPSFWEGSVRPPIATNMGQARALFDTALEEQDFETIWRIGFDMLALGEPAYPIVNELFEKFADEFYGGKLSSPLWRLPELYQGARPESTGPRNRSEAVGCGSCPLPVLAWQSKVALRALRVPAETQSIVVTRHS